MVTLATNCSCPRRRSFLYRGGRGGSREYAVQDMRPWLVAVGVYG